MAKDKAKTKPADEQKPVEQKPAAEQKPAELEEGQVKIKLLQDHGGCKKGDTRIMPKASAQVLIDIDPPIAALVD